LAETLAVSENTVTKWIEDGLVRVIYLGPRTVRIPNDEVERILKFGLTGAPDDNGDDDVPKRRGRPPRTLTSTSVASSN
jgi:excisionase family DNA binding protein